METSTYNLDVESTKIPQFFKPVANVQISSSTYVKIANIHSNSIFILSEKFANLMINAKIYWMVFKLFKDYKKSLAFHLNTMKTRI